MPTHAWSTPACVTSSTKRATSRRLPASYRVQPQTGLSELRNRGYGTGRAPKGERASLPPRHAQVTWAVPRLMSSHVGRQGFASSQSEDQDQNASGNKRIAVTARPTPRCPCLVGQFLGVADLRLILVDGSPGIRSGIAASHSSTRTVLRDRCGQTRAGCRGHRGRLGSP